MKTLNLKTISIINTQIVNTKPATHRIRGDNLKRIRERIIIRDESTCQRCGRVTLNGEVDHIVPLHLGGTETDENRQLLCVSCHNKKSKQEQGDRGR